MPQNQTWGRLLVKDSNQAIFNQMEISLKYIYKSNFRLSKCIQVNILH